MKTKATICFIIIFLGIVCVSNAQDKKFKFGLSAFPNYSIGVKTHKNKIPREVEKMDTWKLSISANLFAEYSLREKSKLIFGLGYQNSGIIDEHSDNTNGYYWTKRTYNLHKIELPLIYQFSLKKSFYGLIGLSNVYRFYGTRKTIVEYNNVVMQNTKEEYYPSSFNEYNLLLNFGCGFNYFNNDKITLFIHPYFQYQLFQNQEKSRIKLHYLSAGIATGIKI